MSESGRICLPAYEPVPSNYAWRFRVSGHDRVIDRSPIHFRSPGPPWALCSQGFFQGAIGGLQGCDRANGWMRLSWLNRSSNATQRHSRPTLLPPRIVPALRSEIAEWVDRWQYSRFVTLATNDIGLART